MPIVGKPEDSPYSGDPDTRLAELADTEAKIRQEIYEREQVLASISARKLKIQQTLQRANKDVQGTSQQAAAMERLQREGLVPNPNQMVRGPDGMVLPNRLAPQQGVAPRLQVPPATPQATPPDPNEMVRLPDGMVLPRRLAPKGY